MWMFWLLGCHGDSSTEEAGSEAPISPIVLDLAQEESGVWTPADEEYLQELRPELRALALQFQVGRVPGQSSEAVSILRNQSDWERMSLHFVRAERFGETAWRLRTWVALHGYTFPVDDGQRSFLQGRIRIDWERDSSGAWTVERIDEEELEEYRSPRFVFRESLEELVDSSLFAELRRSRHEDRIASWFTGESERRRFFEPESFDRHPGLAVVDLNQDGWDDIYLMARWGPNQLLINQSGTGFVEAAAEWGLDIEDHCSSAAFVDYDNDGDPDVLIGRTLGPSLLMENVDGRFRRVPETHLGGPLPRLVSSVSAADFDGDGLTDFYLSTYAASMLEHSYLTAEAQGRLGEPVLENLLPVDDARDLGEALASARFSFFLERPGPRNILLRNMGSGRFLPLDGTHPLSVLRNTYQSAWADFDLDGDPDVYLANDFAPNTLLRNDGEGRFTDITAETGTEDFGFGMGVSWGDYDDDGRPDLYVTNMYSSAGRRIAAVVPDIDERIPKAARGNTLFRNTGDGFERVSSLDDEGLMVERAGWAWGGQFGDIDNDGLEDIYVPNGYYTAPEEVAIDRDT